MDKEILVNAETIKGFMFNTAKRITQLEASVMSLQELVTSRDDRIGQLEESVVFLQKLEIAMDERIDKLNQS